MPLTTAELLTMIDSAWDFTDPAGSDRRFAVILSGLGATNAVAQAAVLTQRARAVGLQRRFPEADALLDQTEMLAGSADPLPRVMLLLERARVRNSSADRVAAAPLLHAAFELARTAGLDALAVDAAHMLAIVERDNALAWNRRAMSLARESPDPRARRWIASLCNNVGWALHDRGDYRGALESFQEALRQREAAGVVAPILIARWCVARCLRSLGLIDEALHALRELEAEHAQRDGADGFVHEEIAECLLSKHLIDAARPHFAKAHQMLSEDPWLAQSEPKRLARLAELGWTAS